MRTRIFLVVPAVLVMFSMLGSAQSAVAAPAVPYQTTDACRLIGGGIIEICVNGHGVVQENESASGVTKVTINGTSTETFTRRGVLFRTIDEKTHETLMFKNGEPHVAHLRESQTVQLADRTCTYDVNVIYANGEVRHEIDNAECH